MKRFLLTCMLTCCVWLSGMAFTVRIGPSPLPVSAGTTFTQSVVVNSPVNGRPDAGMEFDLYLPDGLTVTAVTTYDTYRNGSFTAKTDVDSRGTGHYHIVENYTGSSAPGSTGGYTYINITFKAASTMAAGTRTIELRNIVYKNYGAASSTLSSVSQPVTVTNTSTSYKVHSVGNFDYMFYGNGTASMAGMSALGKAEGCNAVYTSDFIIKNPEDSSWTRTIYVGATAFQYNQLLQYVFLGYHLKRFNPAAFNYCSNLRQVRIPGTLPELFGSGFSGCTKMSILEYTGTDTIGTSSASLFGDIPSTCSLHLPNVHNIKTKFAKSTAWKRFTNVSVDAGDFNIGGSGSYIVTKISDQLDSNGVPGNGEAAYVGVEYLTSVTTPYIYSTLSGYGTNKYTGVLKVTALSEGCCMYNQKITSVTVNGQNLTDGIPVFAFYGCSALEKATLNGVRIVGTSSFYNDVALKSVTFDESLTTIDSYAFRFCSGINTEVVLPKSVISIGTEAFDNCTSMPSMIIKNPDFNTSSRAFGKMNSNFKLYVSNKTFPKFYAMAKTWTQNSSKEDMSGFYNMVYPYIYFENQYEAFSCPIAVNFYNLSCAASVVEDYDGVREIGRFSRVYSAVNANTGLLVSGTKGSYVRLMKPSLDWSYSSLMKSTSFNTSGVTVSSNSNYTAYTWDGVSSSFKKVTGSITIPAGLAYLYLPAADATKATIPISDFASFKEGDVDGNGDVDITDLNIIINIVLDRDQAQKYGKRAYLTRGDLDVDVSDINMLINIILTPEPVN